MTDEQREACKRVINNFDFMRVHRAMTALNWTYGFNKEVPSIGHLVNSAMERMESAIEHGYSCSGGFEARSDEDGIWLRFILTEWDEDWSPLDPD